MSAMMPAMDDVTARWGTVKHAPAPGWSVVPQRAPAGRDGRDAAQDGPLMQTAQRVAEAVELRTPEAPGDVLVVGPNAARLAGALRRCGFAGTSVALVRTRSAGAAALGPEGCDHAVVYDWHAATAPRPADPDAPESAPPADLADLGGLDGSCVAVVAYDLLRLLPPGQLLPAILQFRRFLLPRGYLIISEPAPPFDVRALAADALAAGFQLAADPVHLEDGWPRTLAVLQYRGQQEARLSGHVDRVTWGALATSAALRRNLCDAYRTAFGGDDWREWARCATPGCGRQFARHEVEHRPDPLRCPCGRGGALEPFHTPAGVLAKLREELLVEDESCCYVRSGPDGEVDGFSWGFLADVGDLAATLAAGEPELADPIAAGLRAYLDGRGIGDEAVFYHSELGVREEVRSMSLARGLFHRTFRYAADAGARAIVLRTSMRSNAYPISLGLGLEVLFRYGDHRAPLPPASDESLPREDPRVILGGDLRRLLPLLAQISDAQLALRIGRQSRSVGLVRRRP